ncbi:uncharacterized protein LAESUDRAFT_755777 [Laetiporus sulphureus 93-53]|uniref:Uncharacterized protein n=1 Tax=Laetiporus sulphureus 93-53 TaxID=1314785 RepID=A0A165GFC2_9APHY|nr:uncharacterized protein LAESUDRAFT_755777 [Laetiporus sulphureus 93-53]KZT10271.1 hypothetical protein LAESUDRAFT_755777 [Laetiporus sulphureus 93-53]
MATSMAQVQWQSTEREFGHQDEPSDAGHFGDNVDNTEETWQEAAAEEEEQFGCILSKEKWSDLGTGDEVKEDNFWDDIVQGVEEGGMARPQAVAEEEDQFGYILPEEKWSDLDSDDEADEDDWDDDAQL